MKPAEAIGLIRYNRRFGRSKILKHVEGRMFQCQSLDKYPGVNYLTSWGALKKGDSQIG